MSRRMPKSEMRLRALFLRHAEGHLKKHKAWAIFRFHLEDTFLSMDTWNGAFRYNTGSGGYEYWKGFNGKTFIYFGGNNQWGDNGRDQPLNVTEFYCEKIRKEVRRRDE